MGAPTGPSRNFSGSGAQLWSALLQRTSSSRSGKAATVEGVAVVLAMVCVSTLYSQVVDWLRCYRAAWVRLWCASAGFAEAGFSGGVLHTPVATQELPQEPALPWTAPPLYTPTAAGQAEGLRPS
mmetsp:Transcript_147291/g.473175  ORF Transcript_147291/g.473175 Transcript_147291/m.473175 type:complete len:125 (+) Transcript_147291:1344-1718(+)